MDYLNFFGFRDAPFRLTPDPDYFFPSQAHQEALQTLLYSIRSGEGFVQITGDPGTGKTLLLRTLLKELGDNVTTALILNPCLEPEDLLRVVLDDFGISRNDANVTTKHDLMRLFRDFLLEKAAAGIRVVVIVDEAQNLPLATLEELRLLSNLETDKEKLLQIFLVGQRELEEKLTDSALVQLNQRITIRYRLTPLSLSETETYIRHRLKIAAPTNPAIFSQRIIDHIYQHSRGVPRLVNILCERILMAAYIDNQCEISEKHLENARRSISGEPVADVSKTTVDGSGGSRLNTFMLVLLLVLLLGGSLFYFRQPLKAWLGAVSKSSQRVSPSPPERTHRAAPMVATRQSVSQTGKGHSATNPATTAMPENPVKMQTGPGPEQVDLQKTAASEVERTERKTVAAVSSPPATAVAAADSSKDVGALHLLPDGNQAGEPEKNGTPGKSVPDKAVVDDSVPDSPSSVEAEILSLPAGSAVLLADVRTHQAVLWRGEAGDRIRPAAEMSLSVLAPPADQLPPGISILSLDAAGMLLFNPFNFLSGRSNRAVPFSREKFNQLSQGRPLPVLCFAGSGKPSLSAQEQTALKEELLAELKAWAEAWRRHDLEAFLSYYASVVTIYKPELSKPVALLTREKLRMLKARLFARDRSASIELGKPMLLCDPTNSGRVLAFFRQIYRGSRYRDEGWKGLYLTQNSGSGPGVRWLITAKVFFPLTRRSVEKKKSAASILPEVRPLTVGVDDGD